MTSSNDYDRRLYALFNDALDLVPDARLRMLDALRAEEPLLADRLARMLEADVQGEQQSDTTASLHAALAGALDASQPGELPARIGGYRIEGKLGEGGMGVVYLARREGLADAPAVALKLISERLRSSAAQERFIAEQRSLARLDHPSVCRFIDADTLPDGRPLVIMEAVRGLAVDAWVATEQPSVRTLLGLFIQLLSAVAHAHERLIVHRDIKCSNVLVTSGGQIKLLDFGIAKLMDEAETAQATATSDRFLTPGIAAPEYWARGEVTVATDIYALGALLYRLLSGRDPLQFEGLKPTEIERKLLFIEPDPLSKIASPIFKGQIGSDLEAIVHKCLRKSPSDRYSSADALASDLRRLLDGYPVQARPAGALYRTQLFANRHRGALAACMLGLALVVAWTLSLRASLVEAERQRSLAVAERNRATLVSDILQESILQADPARRSMEFVGAREIMAAAAQRIAPLELSDPSTFADLALSISTIELEYIRNAQAFELAKRGLNAIGRDSHSRLANELRLVGAIAAARELRLTEAEALIDEYLATGAPQSMALQLASARVLMGRARFAEAHDAALRGLALPKANDPSNHLATELRRQNAEILVRLNRREEAEEELAQMLEWQRSALPDNHAWVLETRMHRLPLLANRSDASTILAERDHLITAMSQLFGDTSLQVAFVHVRAGEALSRLGNHSANASALREASRLLLLIRAPTDDTHIRLQLNLGLALINVGTAESLEDAAQVLQTAERIQTSRASAESPLAIHFRTLLARSLVRLGRSEEALAVIAGPEEARWEMAVASHANRSARAVTLGELIESPSLGCRGAGSTGTGYCASLKKRLQDLEDSL